VRRHLLSVFAVLLLAGGLACAPRAVVRQPRVEPLGDVLAREVEEQGAEPWSERPLTWGDFKGPAPAVTGDRGAQTAYTVFHAARCVGERFEFRVITGFLPAESWVAPAVRRDPALSTRTLRHEQTHFDLTEVHARRLRRHFSELYQPCLRTETELSAIAARFMEDEATAQRRYDQETNNGRTAQRQGAWDADVARQLLTLVRYADQTVMSAGAGLFSR
jgi:hypothetical protein